MLTVSPDILILGFIAGFILYRLFSILGRKDDDGNLSNQIKNDTFKEMIDISSVTKVEEIKVDLAKLEKDLAPGFESVVEQIRKLEPNFSLQKFLDGAKMAFEMVIAAFASEDRATLKDLLDADTYKQFSGEIDKRKENKITLDLTLVSLPLIKIENIQLKNNKIAIDVLYASQQINLLKNSDGNIIEGIPSQIDHMEDVWTFAKTLNSRETWKLVKVNAT
jgi:predicted lipid-binding transport protein (Tim44 family)